MIITSNLFEVKIDIYLCKPKNNYFKKKKFGGQIPCTMPSLLNRRTPARYPEKYLENFMVLILLSDVLMKHT